MAQKRSDKSCYRSRFGSEWITGAQWLAENMCSRKARAESGELPQRFWKDEYWEKQLKLQLKHANDLLKYYDIKSISNALKHPDANRVYSLGLKSVLIPLIKKEQKKINIQKEQAKTIEPESVDTQQKPRKAFGSKKSLIQRLREVDNG